MDLQTAIPKTITFFNDAVIPLLLTVAFMVFLWNAFRYFILKGDTEDGQESARSLALWGIGAFAIILSIWGIVAMLVAGLGLDNRAIIPDYQCEKEGGDCRPGEAFVDENQYGAYTDPGSTYTGDGTGDFTAPGSTYTETSSTYDIMDGFYNFFGGNSDDTTQTNDTSGNYYNSNTASQNGSTVQEDINYTPPTYSNTYTNTPTTYTPPQNTSVDNITASVDPTSASSLKNAIDAVSAKIKALLGS